MGDGEFCSKHLAFGAHLEVVVHVGIGGKEGRKEMGKPQDDNY